MNTFDVQTMHLDKKNLSFIYCINSRGSFSVKFCHIASKIFLFLPNRAKLDQNWAYFQRV